MKSINTLFLNLVQRIKNAVLHSDENLQIAKDYADARGDYIVEEGTSGKWVYRKWASGIMECWGWKSISVVVNQSWGTMRYATITAENYPVAFKEQPFLNVYLNSGGGWITGAYSSSVTSTGYFYVMRPDNGNTVAGRVYYFAKGLWKNFENIGGGNT